jgi:hypothetical protein
MYLPYYGSKTKGGFYMGFGYGGGEYEGGGFGGSSILFLILILLVFSMPFGGGYCKK